MRPSALSAVVFISMFMALLLGGLACSVGEERSYLHIQSNPAGAWLYLDGQLAGETPYLVQSPLGVHQVRLVYPCYMPWENEIEIKTAHPFTLTAPLQRDPRGLAGLSPEAGIIPFGGVTVTVQAEKKTPGTASVPVPVTVTISNDVLALQMPLRPGTGRYLPWQVIGGQETLFRGGLAWNLPGVSPADWQYTVDGQDGYAWVHFFTGGKDRPLASATVALAAGMPYFVLSPGLENPGAKEIAYRFVITAAVTMRQATTLLVSREITTSLVAGKKATWPTYEGRDLRLAGHWPPDQELALSLLTPGAYLGAFTPRVNQDGQDGQVGQGGSGLVRVFPGYVVPEMRVIRQGQHLILEASRAGTLPAKGGVTWTERWYRIGNENDMDLSALSRRLW
jgi:hypothetical protein